MKRIELLLLNEIISDVGLMCSASTSRDITTVMSRFKHEGSSFLTITLPTFAKDIEKCLERGRIEPDCFRSFKKIKGSRLIPAFLSGIVSMMFEDSGLLRDRFPTECVDGIRQVCLSFNKLKLECTDERNRKALKQYTDCENDVSSFRIQRYSDLRDFDRVARCIFGRMFDQLENKLRRHDLLPKNGPGAVANRLTSNQKYDCYKWTTRMERIFPCSEYLFTSYSDWAQNNEKVEFLNSRSELPVRVIFVPKTQKTPRVIAIEPSWNQFVQQSLMREIVSLIENDPLLKKCIHFTDSSINGKYARESSITRHFATLDMSEASDRVHASLVHRLIKDFPLLTRAVFSCRSKRAKLPNGEVISIKKFASMGSALCFPFEAMVFATLALIGLHKRRSLRVSMKSLTSLTSKLHVFGDDLIIPTIDAQYVIDSLEIVRLKVNRGKTFIHGYFRESCGVDAYRGDLVTPVYIRTRLPRSRAQAQEILSAVSSCNLLYKKGYWRSSRFIREYLESLGIPLPHVKGESTCVGLFSYLGTYSVERWNKLLHRFEVSGLIQKVKRVSDPVSEDRSLFKFFIERGVEPLSLSSYKESVRRGSVYTKIRWSPPF